jgi:ketosteroid isomerase-like protein
MHEHENVDVVKDAYRAFSEGNLDVLLECLDDNVKWFAIGPPHIIPTAGTRYGPEQVSQYFSLLESSGQLRCLKATEFIAQDDKVVAIGELVNDVKATGSSVRSPWVHVFTLRRGRISEFRSFYDTAAVISALEGIQISRAPRVTSALRTPVIY